MYDFVKNPSLVELLRDRASDNRPLSKSVSDQIDSYALDDGIFLVVAFLFCDFNASRH